VSGQPPGWSGPDLYSLLEEWTALLKSKDNRLGTVSYGGNTQVAIHATRALKRYSVVARMIIVDLDPDTKHPTHAKIDERYTFQNGKMISLGLGPGRLMNASVPVVS
jgi:hypothetical protein